MKTVFEIHNPMVGKGNNSSGPDSGGGLRGHSKSHLSLASRRWDAGNKGYLDEVESVCRKFDYDGDGKFNRQEIKNVVKELLMQKKSASYYRKLVLLAVLFCIVSSATVFFLALASNEVSKETHVSEIDGNLIDRNGGIVNTGDIRAELTLMDLPLLPHSFLSKIKNVRVSVDEEVHFHEIASYVSSNSSFLTLHTKTCGVKISINLNRGLAFLEDSNTKRVYLINTDNDPRFGDFEEEDDEGSLFKVFSSRRNLFNGHKIVKRARRNLGGDDDDDDDDDEDYDHERSTAELGCPAQSAAVALNTVLESKASRKCNCKKEIADPTRYTQCKSLKYKDRMNCICWNKCNLLREIENECSPSYDWDVVKGYIDNSELSDVSWKPASEFGQKLSEAKCLLSLEDEYKGIDLSGRRNLISFRRVLGKGKKKSKSGFNKKHCSFCNNRCLGKKDAKKLMRSNDEIVCSTLESNTIGESVLINGDPSNVLSSNLDPPPTASNYGEVYSHLSSGNSGLTVGRLRLADIMHDSVFAVSSLDPSSSSSQSSGTLIPKGFIGVDSLSDTTGSKVYFSTKITCQGDQSDLYACQPGSTTPIWLKIVIHDSGCCQCPSRYMSRSRQQYKELCFLEDCHSTCLPSDDDYPSIIGRVALCVSGKKYSIIPFSEFNSHTDPCPHENNRRNLQTGSANSS